MRNMKVLAGLLIAILHFGLLSGCGQQEPNRPGSSDASAKAEIMSHDLGPFFSEETAMYNRMRAAVGTNSADSWTRMMIAHHEGGAAISRIALSANLPMQEAQLVRRTLEEQEEAVDTLRRSLVDGIPSVDDALIFVDPIQSTHDETMAIFGSDVFEVWLRKMIGHHRGAIGMCDVLLRQNGLDPETALLVRSLRAKQVSEMGVLEKALDQLGR